MLEGVDVCCREEGERSGRGGERAKVREHLNNSGRFLLSLAWDVEATFSSPKERASLEGGPFCLIRDVLWECARQEIPVPLQ